MPFDPNPDPIPRVPDSAADRLERLREFFKRYRWTQGSYARAHEDRPVQVMDNAAISFCLVGAANRLNIDQEVLARDLGFPNSRKMINFNDAGDTTVRSVVSLIRASLRRFE